ncbi:MAG: S10 family peptidase [Terriglobales bacterium]
MTRGTVSGWIMGFLLATLPLGAAGQRGMMPGAPPPPTAKPAPIPKERTAVTHASVTINGQTIGYTATAGTLLLYNDKQKATASVFYIAYTKDGISDSSTRPVTFAYNGGPGGASALVDIGGFGPRRIAWPKVDQYTAYAPPYRLVANADSILDSTDLVFVDAVGTGYSQIVGEGTPKMFYGISEDASTFAQFIERYLKHFHRWDSPKFILGESYGTTRNAVLADDLVNQGVYLNGVVMCSTVLNFATASFGPGNDLPYVLYLPSYAAAAWYHHRLSPQPASLQALLTQVRRFAGGAYAAALFAGVNLPPAQEQAVAAQLQQFTGIPASLWEEAHLRIALGMFRRRLMGSEGPEIGRYDSRFTGPELEPLLPVPGQDDQEPSSSAVMGAVTALFDRYVSQTLNFHSQRIYTELSYAVGRQWDLTFRAPLGELSGGGGAPDVAPALARAMNNDPALHVQFNNGYYDMATPFFATEYTAAHMQVAPSERGHIEFQYYPVGHMLYVNPEALPMLHKNIDAFIAASTPRAQ